MKKNNVQFVTKSALIAAAYAALTFVFSGISYGEIQFRISEILVLFVLIEPKYATGLVIGCILANLPSPLGVIDIVAGSIATLFAIIYIIKVKNIFGLNIKSLLIASLGPVISNAILVGAELTYVFKTPFLFNAIYVAAGEFAVVTIAGTIAVNGIINNNTLCDKLKINSSVR